MLASSLKNLRRSPANLLQNYWLLIRYLGWSRFALIQVLGILVGIFSVVGFAAMLPLLTLLLNDKETLLNKLIYPYVPSFLIPELLKENPLLFIIAGIFTAYTLKMFLTVAYSGLGSLWIETFTGEARAKLIATYTHLLEKKLERAAKTRILHLNSQLPMITSYNWGLLELLIKLYVLLFTAAFLLGLSIKLASAVLALGVIIALFLAPFARWTRTTMAKMFEAQHRALETVNHYIDGIDTIRTNNLRERENAKLSAVTGDLIKNVVHVGVSRQFFFSLPEWTIVTALVTVLALYSIKEMQVALLLTYGYALTKFMAALNDLGNRYNIILETHKGPQEIYNYLKQMNPDVHAAPNRSIGPITAIEFQNTTVKSESETILKGATFSLPCKTVSQLVGANGSGKTTLLKCLAKLIPYEGKILINGIELREIAPDEFYKRVTYHGQDNFLFPGTILENILAASPKKSAKDVSALCEKLQINLSSLFPHGMQHQIAEDAKNLSGGERQIICLVRTFLRDTDVYLLDEFTNHLSEDYVRRFLNYIEGLKDKTICIVSHHPLTANGYSIKFEAGMACIPNPPFDRQNTKI